MQEVPVSEAWQRKYPEPTILATCVDEAGRPNAITLGWSMCTSFQPPMMAISIGKTRYSHELIMKTREFVLVFPSEDMAEAVMFCGTHSGRDVDKFKETGLKILPAKFVKAPLIDGAVANFECKVVGTLETGDHTIFAGEILAAYVDEEKEQRLYNLGGYKLDVIRL